MRKLTPLFVMVFLLCAIQAFAQQNTITGKITDAATGSPLEGVTVTVKATGAGTATAKDGSFSIKATPADKLLVSYIGYNLMEIAVGNQTSLTIQLTAAYTDLGQFVTIGTRRTGRIKTETPVPVDVVNIAQAAFPTGRMDVTSILNYAAPSFNYNKQSGADGADHIDLATLRGLGPDQTLVLVNGKRRHQTAFVAVFGTRGRGNSGTDLSAIPLASIDRIEILRDGASAQYGSDAIAGVINIILKKDVKHFSINAGYSGYYDKKYNTHFAPDDREYPSEGAIDGNAFNLGMNYGFNIGTKGGYMNLGANLTTSGKTFRQILDNEDFLNNRDALYPNYVRRANGDASLNAGGLMLNAEIPLNETRTSQFYAFGGYNYKSSDAYAFTRTFSSRPNRFPTDAEGNLIFVEDIMYRLPDGDVVYNPHIQSNIQDGSLAVGIKGKNGTGWNWDLSNTFGMNNYHFYGDKTFNASLGADQTHFDDGGFNFMQNTVNANFSKEIPNVAEGFNLAMGAEFRYERYKLFAGEEASYKNYSDGSKASGAQGFPGYQPSDEVDANRSAFGGYVDAEIDITSKLLMGGAIRLENYSDFGFTANFKYDMRYKISDFVNLRGSISTGFRAPSLQQINFSSTFTTVQGGNISEVKIAPNYSEITQAAGIPELKQEKSLNASLGFSIKPLPEFTITIDGYWVQIKDRVVLSGQFDASDENLDPEFREKMAELNVGLAQFFANAVNTTNRGIDVVADYNKKFGKHSIRALFTGNLQYMSIDQINVPDKLDGSDFLRKTFLSDREQAFIKASAPSSKMALNLEYGIKNFTVGTRFTYFGNVRLLGYGEDGLGINPMVPSDADESIYVPDQYFYQGKVVTDLYFSYKLSKSATIFWGVDNLLNVHPDYGFQQSAKYWAFNNETGGPWDAVQMGFNGMRLFARAAFNF